MAAGVGKTGFGGVGVAGAAEAVQLAHQRHIGAALPDAGLYAGNGQPFFGGKAQLTQVIGGQLGGAIFVKALLGVGENILGHGLQARRVLINDLNDSFFYTIHCFFPSFLDAVRRPFALPRGTAFAFFLL